MELGDRGWRCVNRVLIRVRRLRFPRNGSLAPLFEPPDPDFDFRPKREGGRLSERSRAA